MTRGTVLSFSRRELSGDHNLLITGSIGNKVILKNKEIKIKLLGRQTFMLMSSSP